MLSALANRKQKGDKTEDVELEFTSEHPECPKILLRYDSLLQTANKGIRYPDFLITLRQQKKIEGEEDPSVEEYSFVIDSKFKDWDEEELQSTLKELYTDKDYSNGEKYPVFIVHPKKNIVKVPVSPLIWSEDCDYGGEKKCHKNGHILLSPALGSYDTQWNLRRLLVMFIQQVSTDFCPQCGMKTETKEKRTQGGYSKYVHICPQCSSQVWETHCYRDGYKPLFKNGPIWTYHLSRVESVYNICCPNCGSYFKPKIWDEDAPIPKYLEKQVSYEVAASGVPIYGSEEFVNTYWVQGIRIVWRLNKEQILTPYLFKVKVNNNWIKTVDFLKTEPWPGVGKYLWAKVEFSDRNWKGAFEATTREMPRPEVYVTIEGAVLLKRKSVSDNLRAPVFLEVVCIRKRWVSFWERPKKENV